MIQQDIDALTGRFFDIFDEDDPQIIVENQPAADLDETQLWMRFSVQEGSSQLVQTGLSPIYHQLGTATLQIFMPAGTGTADGGQVRDQFLAAFRDWRSDDKKLRVYKASNNKSGAPGYVQLNAIVFWESKR